jgi:hypothetical protein
MFIDKFNSLIIMKLLDFEFCYMTFKLVFMLLILIKVFGAIPLAVHEGSRKYEFDDVDLLNTGLEKTFDCANENLNYLNFK